MQRRHQPRRDRARGQDVGFETHLEIEAPADTAVEVRNDHGRVDLAGVGERRRRLVLRRRLGREDRGRPEARVQARRRTRERGRRRLELRARHGSVEVSDVKGRAKLDVEHGDLSARRTGPLQITHQHGGVNAEGVAGDLEVRGGHSEVRASDVRGNAEVETSFGGIRLARRRQGASEGRARQVTAEDVPGGLVAETSHDGVEVDRVDGPLVGDRATTAGSRRAASRRAPACARREATCRSTASRARSRSRSSAAARRSPARGARGADQRHRVEGRGAPRGPRGQPLRPRRRVARAGSCTRRCRGLDRTEPSRRGTAPAIARASSPAAGSRSLRADGDVTLEAKPGGRDRRSPRGDAHRGGAPAREATPAAARREAAAAARRRRAARAVPRPRRRRSTGAARALSPPDGTSAPASAPGSSVHARGLRARRRVARRSRSLATRVATQSHWRASPRVRRARAFSSCLASVLPVDFPPSERATAVARREANAAGRTPLLRQP